MYVDNRLSNGVDKLNNAISNRGSTAPTVATAVPFTAPDSSDLLCFWPKLGGTWTIDNPRFSSSWGSLGCFLGSEIVEPASNLKSST